MHVPTYELSLVRNIIAVRASIYFNMLILQLESTYKGNTWKHDSKIIIKR